MNIRPAKQEDAQAIINFQMRMALETEDLELDQATVTKGVNAVFVNPSKGTYWVVQQDNQVVASLFLVDEWSDWRNGTVKWIHSVYVLPEYRKNGVFKELYQTIKSMVEDSKDIRGLRLYVDKKNERAQKVYENLGMSGDHYHLYEWLK